MIYWIYDYLGSWALCSEPPSSPQPWVVAIGALLNILLIWMLDMDVTVHSLLGGSLALFLGVVIFMIAALDHPFRGEVSIEPDAIQQVYDTLMNAPRATSR